MAEVWVGPEPYCDYSKIQEAVDALERTWNGTADESGDVNEHLDVLYIMPGVYEEAVKIYRSYLHIKGLGEVEIRMNTCARQKDASGQPIGTFATPTLFLGGRKIIMENITVTNSAGQGPEIGQALAVYAHCDEAVFRYCTFKGYQDTLFTGPLPPSTKEGKPFEGIPLREKHRICRQLYEYCVIEGTVDFIFGGAAAWFDHCQMISLPHYRGAEGYITAASTPQDQPYGYVLNRCYLSAQGDTGPVYLGRPWRPFAKTEFVNCRMESHLHPEGWHNWDRPENEATVIYKEWGTVSAIKNPVSRVGWAYVNSSGEGAPRREDVLAGSEFISKNSSGTDW
ncbi:pectinesterase family protein [Paenibacillus sp. JX-17]|uniref:Pectinesterase n=1 Tax=Paenibacillus lacisoli TaxID=3064525 RepID=A0ABT9C8I0_9BACL|nr:pectinesterase family protein [Paenibacillus sp. JX-17]MDO7905536.1 pectinesterase family protein [Paenibacillus sp. JX-17]